MTDDKLYTSLSANTIMAKVTNHFQRTKLITSSTDKHYSLDSEDDFRSGCRNVSHQQQFFSELHSFFIFIAVYSFYYLSTYIYLHTLNAKTSINSEQYHVHTCDPSTQDGTHCIPILIDFVFWFGVLVL